MHIIATKCLTLETQSLDHLEDRSTRQKVCQIPKGGGLHTRAAGENIPQKYVLIPLNLCTTRSCLSEALPALWSAPNQAMCGRALLTAVQHPEPSGTKESATAAVYLDGVARTRAALLPNDLRCLHEGRLHRCSQHSTTYCCTVLHTCWHLKS